MNAVTPINLNALCPAAFATGAHPSRSSKYTFIPTLNTLEALTAEGYSVASAMQTRTRLPGNELFTKHLIRLRAPGLGNAEAVPEVILTNSHNGNGAYKVMGGMFRFFCFNGMIASDGRIESVSIRHSGNVIGDVIEGVMKVMSNARETMRVITDWRQLELTAEEQLDFAEQAYLARWPLVEGVRQNAVQPKQLLEVKRPEDAGDDLWHIFNRVQENITQGGVGYTAIRHDQGVVKSRNVATRAIRGIDETVKINQKLWALAEAVAL